MRLRFGLFGLGLSVACALSAQQSQFQGSVPAGTASGTPLALTLRGAIERGLKTNLGLLVSDSDSEIARGQRARALSTLLPQVTGSVSEVEQQISLKTLGFNLNIPGVAFPTILGPFHYTDARAAASWTAFDYSARKNHRSARGERARVPALGSECARPGGRSGGGGLSPDHRGRFAVGCDPVAGGDGAGALSDAPRISERRARPPELTFCGRRWS